ncbi:MAG TPA: hypothetical protein VGR38_07280 [Candidatus Polarisedimenticolia bacterium]|nr:hypothetical protein [Candidatus Polarisedimenticolia bacterium]
MVKSTLSLFLLAGVTAHSRAQGEIPTWQPPKTGLGYQIDLARPAPQRPGPLASREVQSRGAQPLYARVIFSWESLEKERGTFHLEELDDEVRRFQEAGFEVILAPRGGNSLYGDASSPSAAESESLSAWRVFLSTLARHFKGKVRFYEIGAAPHPPDGPTSGIGAREYAFLLKNGAVELRGADPEALIVMGSIPARKVDFLDEVLREDVAAYVDAVALSGEAGVDPGETVNRASEILLQRDPSASIWLVDWPLPGERPIPQPAEPADPSAPAEAPPSQEPRLRAGAMIQAAASAFSAGAHLVLFDLGPDESGAPELGNLLVLLRRLFLPSLGPSPEGVGRLRLRARPEGAAVPLTGWRFFDASTFQVLLVYLSPPGSTGSADLILDTADVTGAVVDDLLAGSEVPVAALSPGSAGTMRAEVPLAQTPLILRYQRFATPGFQKGKESAQVKGTRELTAEEIIARHQEFQADQDRRLATVMASGRISYHYTVPSAKVSIDVTTLNNFYWDRTVGAEWEQKEFYFNGVKWTGKKPPDLPLIQPEKVVILPLDINLNKDYTYRLQGRDTVEGRECYVLEFAPVPGKARLYRGKVWIDRKSFAKVRISSVQTALAPPVTSNDEEDTYGPAPGAGGNPLWVLQRIKGQQRHSLSGVNLIVMREVEFSDFVLNSAEFESRRKAAYASEHSMLRDTEKGFRYLDRNPTGERTVREGVTRRTILGAAGVFYQQSLDFPVPLLGVDYFNFDFKNTKSQVNLFFAGALLQGSIQDPNLFGTKMDAGVSVLGVAFSTTDHYYLTDERIESVDVRTRDQQISANLGYPLGNFFKVKALASLDWAQFGHAEDAADSFRGPPDTFETTFGVLGQFDRRGWTVQARAEQTRRSAWEAWGDTDPLSEALGSRFSDFDPDDRSFRQYRGHLSKQIILPRFQKVILSAEYMTGSHLDRFSKFHFGFFDTRVHGFSGSGVRFDRGVTATASYNFNLANVIRFDATVDWARVRNEDLEDLDPTLAGDQSFGGFGLSGNFMGPWNTVIQFDYGIAVTSDIPGLEGDQEIEFVMLKFF